MRAKLRLIIVFLLVGFGLNAQTKKGTVLDVTTDEPIENISVYFLNNPKIGVSSDSKGGFFLNFSKAKESDTISFHHISYSELQITYADLKKQDFIVKLQPKGYSIAAVDVKGGKIELPEVKFKKVTSFKYGIHSFDPLLVGDTIYIVGGDISTVEKTFSTESGDKSYYEYNDKMFIYDISNDEWIASEQRFRKRAYHSAQYFNGKIYVLGGKNLSTNRKYEYLDNVIEVYDLKKDTMILDYNNPHQAVNFASGLYGEYLILAGGSIKEYTMPYIKKKAFTDRVHLFNLLTGEWFELDRMPQAKESKGIVVDSLFYCVGGLYQAKNGTEASRDISIYNIKSGEWINETSLAFSVERPGLAYYNDLIYIYDRGVVQTYNIKTKELMAYQVDLNMNNASLLYNDDKLYVLGGFYGSIDIGENSFPSWDIFSIELKEFARYLDKTIAGNDF